jgi:hypothetical protein
MMRKNPDGSWYNAHWSEPIFEFVVGAIAAVFIGVAWLIGIAVAAAAAVFGLWAGWAAFTWAAVKLLS